MVYVSANYKVSFLRSTSHRIWSRRFSLQLLRVGGDERADSSPSQEFCQIMFQRSFGSDARLKARPSREKPATFTSLSWKHLQPKIVSLEDRRDEV